MCLVCDEQLHINSRCGRDGLTTVKSWSRENGDKLTEVSIIDPEVSIILCFSMNMHSSTYFGDCALGIICMQCPVTYGG